MEKNYDGRHRCSAVTVINVQHRAVRTVCLTIMAWHVLPSGHRKPHSRPLPGSGTKDLSLHNDRVFAMLLVSFVGHARYKIYFWSMWWIYFRKWSKYVDGNILSGLDRPDRNIRFKHEKPTSMRVKSYEKWLIAQRRWRINRRLHSYASPSIIDALFGMNEWSNESQRCRSRIGSWHNTDKGRIKASSG